MRVTNNFQGFVLSESEEQPLCAFARRNGTLDFPHHALFFHNLEPGNYGSFLFRQLPQLLLFCRLLRQNPATDFTCYVVPERTPWLLSALTCLGLPSWPIFALSEVCGDRFKSVAIFNAFDAEGFFSEEIWDELSHMVERASALRPTRGKKKSIYVSRRLLEVRHPNYRKLLNASAVENAFAEAGFEIIYPEVLLFEEQINLFATAMRIAGPSGSGMLNAIFAGIGTKVLDMESFTMNVRQHAKIYASTHKVYGFLFGDLDDNSQVPAAARNWEVPPKPLIKALQWLNSGDPRTVF